MNTLFSSHKRRQSGVALAIGLILLVAITIVVLATMSGTKINEKIASNTQQKAISFEAAESAIDTIWIGETLSVLLASIPPVPFDNPVAIVPNVPEVASLSTDFDQLNSAGTALSVDITAGVTFKYCGQVLRPRGVEINGDENGRQYAGMLLDVNGKAKVAGSKASSDHLQRGYITRLKFDRPGSCQTPGT